MRLATGQMSMCKNVNVNLDKTVQYIQSASEQKADLIFFPELQLSPFFPQYEQQNAEPYLLSLESPEIKIICQACKEYSIYASPNVYLHLDGNRYDVSLMIDNNGKIMGISKMVHIFQAEHFYEKDYYTPSDSGFKVYDTPFGKIGIVICFDRHIPESIRSCALKGAQLILIPTANLTSEPTDLFEWEVRVQAFQNLSYIAMCNRVGIEDKVCFCGQSLIASYDGGLLYKADDTEQLIISDISLDTLETARKQRDWLSLAKEKQNDIS